MNIKVDHMWKPKERVKEMKIIINDYRNSFKLFNNSDVQIWKTIIRKYNKKWDSLHYDSINYEEYLKYKKRIRILV